MTYPEAGAEAAGGKANPGAASGTRRNLLLRLVSAVLALACIYGCLWYFVTTGSGWIWAAFVAAASILGLREFYRLARTSGVEPFAYFGYAVSPLWILAVELDVSGLAANWGVKVEAGLFAAILAVGGSMLLQLTRKSNVDSIVCVALTVTGLLYCSFLTSFIVRLGHLELSPGGAPMDGAEFIIVCIFITKVSDVGALVTGKRWGKRKLIPRLSPGKTWEGAIGGLCFSVLLLQFMVWQAPWMALAGLGWWKLVLLSIILAVVGLGGDLVESCFKRNSRQKDAGTGVPGFGGVLDLVDSLLVACPAMYIFLVLNGAAYARPH